MSSSRPQFAFLANLQGVEHRLMSLESVNFFHFNQSTTSVVYHI